MGPLTLPSSGSFILTPVVSSTVWNGVEPYRTLLEPMWQEAQDGDFTVMSSPSL